MSYLVLARKWRPRSFDTLIGQDHVVRALTHALDSGRLHHAWLFTGTRGVGKTTLSRILAKSLNCEQGVTATPCGHCRACTEIDAGRYVDYIELDAASNRGVDEMTQLLEQAVYAPSSARYKVYMIDEVHMLTGHAFNAMLKTLEEPPEHVKFILATTDPQKIPVTVLSRCLQFNLKQMTVTAIVDHLRHVLAEESIPAEAEALRLIAQAAGGSMRDALSLTDQAISFSAGQLTGAAARDMLGTLDQHHLVTLLRALAAADTPGILAVADDLAARGLSYQAALADLAVLLSRIAIAQRLGAPREDDDPLAPEIQALAQALQPDEVQLFYAVAVNSRHELSLAPDEYAGFVMACLRMLALLPADRAATPVPPAAAPAPAPAGDRSAAPDAGPAMAPAASSPAAVPPPAASEVAPPPGLVPAVPGPAAASGPAAPGPDASPAPKAEPDAALPAVAELEPAPEAGPEAEAAGEPPGTDGPPAWDDDIPDFPEGDDGLVPVGIEDDEVLLDEAPPGAVPATGIRGPAAAAPLPDPRDVGSRDWPALAAALPVTGAAAELAVNSEWISGDEHQVRLRVAIQSLTEGGGPERLRTVLSEHFGRVIRLEIECGSTGEDTAYAVDQSARAARQQAAEDAVPADAVVQAMTQAFGARVVPGSVRPPAV
ncbi:DNA polymerase III subunit gamma/tau [Castellaniella sp. S9]|uniref:DNA polymerase III subunit gamma/tau n=1 Tax=Castellaniella sp. S9 TaxID=2993652 RepID=UPI0022B446F1|nr:DNA polymerase III subunit gamma/tau [Castellaniella sp. S9]